MERIYLKNIGLLIERKDIRTIRKWCRENSISIYNDSSGEFVYKPNLDLAYDMPLIKSLKLKFGELWEEQYELHRCGELYKNLRLHDISSKKYKPKGTISLKFFGVTRK